MTERKRLTAEEKLAKLQAKATALQDRIRAEKKKAEERAKKVRELKVQKLAELLADSGLAELPEDELKALLMRARQMHTTSAPPAAPVAEAAA